jgi:hypothetical protein
MFRRVALPFISLSLLALPVIAGDVPEGIECYESASYFVVAKAHPNESGTDFLARPKPEGGSLPPCEYRKTPGAFEIKNEDAEYYLGLAGDFLVLDSGTGNVRDLIVWDLNGHKRVFVDQYSEPIEITPQRLRFWSETGPATKSKCPDLRDWGGEIVTETRTTLELPSFKVVRHPETRCSPRE